MPFYHDVGRAGMRARAARLLAAAFGLLAAGCVSMSAADAQLTALGRQARPLRGQSLAEHVDDAASCREQVLDRLARAGAYALYNPFTPGGSAGALRAWREQFARCLRDRGYAVPE